LPNGGIGETRHGGPTTCIMIHPSSNVVPCS
jgi:hypothetical protein